MRTKLGILLAITTLALLPTQSLWAHPWGEYIGSALDPTLCRDLFLWEKYQISRDPLVASRMIGNGLNPTQDKSIPVFIYLRETPNAGLIKQLDKHGLRPNTGSWVPPVGANLYGFLLARVTPEQVKSLIQSGMVVRVASAYRKLYPLNDLAAEETAADQAWEQNPPLRGAGVRIVVIDSGFQLAHPDLPDPVATMDYADYPDTNEDVTDLVSGHGTHVAGTVFGSGVLSSGRWKGMAPDADPIYFKIGDDSTTNASTAAVVAALKGAADWADADIATMSYGGFDGFCDGSSPEEQAVDYAVSQGVTVFMSAGNSGYYQDHYYGSVGAGETSAPIQVVVKRAPDSTFWELYMTWRDGADTSVHIALSVAITDALGDTLECDDPGQVSSLRGTEMRMLLPHGFVPRDSTSYFVLVTNHSGRDQDFHLKTQDPLHYVRFNRSSKQYLVLSPSTADSCISVAAYISRTAWTDYLGIFHNEGTIRGAIAGFSSLGPRIDGVLKPDIGAPGKQTISCRGELIDLGGEHGLDYRIVSNDGGVGTPADYIALEGTSMSSPAAAGAAALILEANPDFSPSELRRLIFNSAAGDSMTGELPNFTWGWGKINVANALTAPPDPSFEPAIPRRVEILSAYPNPFNGFLSVTYLTHHSDPIDLAIFDMGGREVGSMKGVPVTVDRQANLSLPLGNLPAGSYWIKLGNQRGWAVRRVSLIK